MLRYLISLVALANFAWAAASFEAASAEVAKAIAPRLQGKTVAVLDLLDQSRNVRELGRVFADQYLRVDLAGLGVRVVTRSALDRALQEIKLSQSGLTEAIASGQGVKFRAADVVVTGSISLSGEQFTVAVEAIDVKTGDSIALARSNFPKTASVQGTWETILEHYSSTTTGDTQTNTDAAPPQANGTASFAGTWKGEASNSDGWIYNLEATFTLSATGNLNGNIKYTLKASSRKEYLEKIGQSGNVYVGGTFDPSQLTAELSYKSYENSSGIFDYYVVYVSSYKLKLSPDGSKITGAIKTGAGSTFDLVMTFEKR